MNCNKCGIPGLWASFNMWENFGIVFKLTLCLHLFSWCDDKLFIVIRVSEQNVIYTEYVWLADMYTCFYNACICVSSACTCTIIHISLEFYTYSKCVFAVSKIEMLLTCSHTMECHTICSFNGIDCGRTYKCCCCCCFNTKSYAFYLFNPSCISVRLRHAVCLRWCDIIELN